jgi:glycosyltransferase involved in cell wall biosynthesis
LYIITKSNWGGAGAYVYGLALEALKNGYAPVVACGGEGLLTERLAQHGIPTHQIRSLERDPHFFKDLRAFLDIRTAIIAVAPAVVHVNSSKAGGMGALAARLAHIPCIIYTVHGLPQREDRSWIAKKIIACIVWLSALLAHRVIAVTAGDAEILRRQPFLRKKVHYIPNGIEHAGLDRTPAREIIRTHITDPAVRKKLTHPLWVGTVAELTDNKGHRYALEAFIEMRHRHPDVAYVIVGEGELSEEYKKFVELHDLADHVFFTGFVPNGPQLYSAFDVYLSPSIKEGMPYTILEAMASGVPVVATSVGGVPDVIEDGVSGTLIPPASPRAIAGAIARILEDGAYGARLGEAGRSNTLSSHTRSAMAARTFALYTHCAQPTRKAMPPVLR